MHKKQVNPMHEARHALKTHPTCGARCRTTAKMCKNPAMLNGRCRMHGGRSTGRPISHGRYTNEAKLLKTNAKECSCELKKLIAKCKTVMPAA